MLSTSAVTPDSPLGPPVTNASCRNTPAHSPTFFSLSTLYNICPRLPSLPLRQRPFNAPSNSSWSKETSGIATELSFERSSGTATVMA